MKEFKIVLDQPEILKDSIGIINGLITELKFNVTTEGIKAVSIDPTNVAMVIFDLFSSACVEWDVKEPFSFALNLNQLHNVLKNVKKTDIIILSDIKKENKITISLKGRTIRNYDISLIEIEKDEKVPELQHKAKIIMSSKDFRDQIKEVFTVADSTEFKAIPESETFIISASNKLGTDINIPNNQLDSFKVEDEQTAKYSIEYLKKFIGGYKLADDVSINFSSEYPLIVEYKSIDKFSLRFLLANRIQNE